MTTKRWWVSVLFVGALYIGCGSEDAKDPEPGKVGSGDSITYNIGSLSNVQSIYPYNGASWLPSMYAQHYTANVTDTVARFTTQSLQRDGFPGYVATAQVQDGSVFVHIGPNASATSGGVGIPEWMSAFAVVHQKFVDEQHALQAVSGVSACQQNSLPNPTMTHCADSAGYCWNSECENYSKSQGTYVPTDPWALYLPFGLGMINQKVTLFLDYPPDSSLSQGDYLDNFTMCRYNRVLLAVINAQNAAPYDTIVDSRPLAAPGSGMSNYLPDPVDIFNTPSPQGGYYLTPMLQLLTNPSQTSQSQTLPVVVMGSPAQKAWKEMLNLGQVVTLDTGATPLASGSVNTPWIAGNHPDSTTYGCCPNDPSSGCQNTDQYDNQNLCFSEHQDFIMDCWIGKMTNGSGTSYSDALSQCETQWILPPAPVYTDGKWTPDQGCDANYLPPAPNDAQTFCVQAKLDNNNKSARCPTVSDAVAYCQNHSNNPCATFDCDGHTGAPAPDTCNQYRDF